MKNKQKIDLPIFVKASNSKDFKEVFEHNLEVFSDTPDFDWTFEDIKKKSQEDGSFIPLKLNSKLLQRFF